MSLLSVHMGLDGVCQQRQASQSLDNMDKQEGSMTTGGRCVTLVRATTVSSLPRRHEDFKLHFREREFFFLSNAGVNSNLLRVEILNCSLWRDRWRGSTSCSWEERK